MLTDTPTLLSSAPIAGQAYRVGEEDGVTIAEVIRVWPSPAWYSYTAEGAWEEHHPFAHVRWADEAPEGNEDDDPDLIPVDAMGWDLPLQPLFAEIPAPVRAALMPQDDWICWAALKLVHAVPEVLDVVQDNPTLGGMLAVHVDAAEDREATCRQLRDLLRRPRHHLLPLLGLPARRSYVGILGRIDPMTLGIPTAWLQGISGSQLVINLLNSDDALVRKWIRHLPRIRADVVITLMHEHLRALCTFDLLADPDKIIYWGLHTYLSRIATGRSRAYASPTPALFRSRAELMEAIHDLPRPEARRWKPSDFPRPFTPPTEDEVLQGRPSVTLTGVRSAAVLHALGVENELCIAEDRRFPERSARGDGAVYVAAWEEGGEPLAATVSLRVSKATGWSVRQVRLPDNGKAPDWLAERLATWAAGIAVRPDLFGPPPELGD